MRKSLRVLVMLIFGLACGTGAGMAVVPDAPAVPGGNVILRAIPVADLPGVHGWHVVDAGSGAALDVYADAVSVATARAAMPRLLEMLRMHGETFGVPAGAVRWFSVQFTHDAALSAALRARGLGAWRVPTAGDGGLARGTGLDDGPWALQAMLPHEQAHAADAQHVRAGVDVPLWWIEGIATWAGARVLQRDASDWAVAARRRAESREAEELAAADGQIDLRGMRRNDSPRVEAILRQLSPAQRETFLKTGALPQIALLFTDEDMEQTPHMGAHYIAAGRLFARVEAAAGLAKMHAWFRAVAAEAPGRLDSDRIAALCLRHTGIDIRPDLDNRSARR